MSNKFVIDGKTYTEREVKSIDINGEIVSGTMINIDKSMSGKPITAKLEVIVSNEEESGIIQEMKLSVDPISGIQQIHENSQSKNIEKISILKRIIQFIKRVMGK